MFANLFIAHSPSLKPSRGPALAQTFKAFGFTVETVGTTARIYKRLPVFFAETWERDAYAKLKRFERLSRVFDIQIVRRDPPVTLASSHSRNATNHCH